MTFVDTCIEALKDLANVEGIESVSLADVLQSAGWSNGRFMHPSDGLVAKMLEATGPQPFRLLPPEGTVKTALWATWSDEAQGWTLREQDPAD